MGNPVVLLFGGVSSERRVSVASAQHLLEALGVCGCWFIAPDGAIHVCAPEVLAAHEQAFERDFDPRVPASWPSLDAALAALGDRSTVMVLALHGGAGEDGTVQRMLEAHGLAFTGSGSEASARAFDKAWAKDIVSVRGVRTVTGSVLGTWDPDMIATIVRDYLATSGAVVLKPVADGSSVGLCFVRSEAEVDEAAAALARSEITYLVEPFVAGIEVTVGVVDDPDGPCALPATEIRVEPGRVFDYEGKYLGAGTREITPAEVPAEHVARAARVAVTAHVALGCVGYSRTDIILNDGDPVFLELNTLPGLTRASLIPQQLRAAGRTMADFVARQIELAIARRDQRAVGASVRRGEGASAPLLGG